MEKMSSKHPVNNKTKSEKKLEKKLRKKVFNFLKEYTESETTLEISNEPSNYLYIGNSGMLCGYTRETIMKLFNPYGHISKLIMIPNKSFSFLSYQNTISSTKALDALQNYSSTTDMKNVPQAPFYIQYINKLPSTFELNKQYPTVGVASTIDGLIVMQEFINEQEEQELIEFFQSNKTNACHGTMKHRSVTHYGYEFLYGSNNIDKSNPLKNKIPSVCDTMIEKMVNDGLMLNRPDQLTVNQYEPGQGIPPHVDTHSAFEDSILSLSLGSQVTMEFSHPNGDVVPVLLPRRSLLCMKEEARYLWTHGIIPRKSDIVYTQDTDATTSPEQHLTLLERGTRISLTFRKILHTACNCSFPKKCDSQLNKTSENKDTLLIPNSSTEARNLESEHVHEVYEEIAEHFSGTRHSPWPRVKEFLCNLPNGSLIADIGCGNGKYLGVNPKVVAIGSDRSLNLCSICKERGFPIIQSDIMKVPFRERSFDGCICIAVIHHLSTPERRLDAFNELIRIVKVGGLVLAYVWAIEQTENDPAGTKSTVITSDENVGQVSNLENVTDIDFDNTCSNRDKKDKENKENSNISSKKTPDVQNEIHVSAGRNMFQQQDLLIPWHLKGNEEKVFHRFYHVFKEGELRELCNKITNIEIVEIYFDKGNWCIILKRIK